MSSEKAKLRAALKRVRWSQREFSEWLTCLGEPTTLRRVEGWVAQPGSRDSTTCPAWPRLLLEASQTQSTSWARCAAINMWRNKLSFKEMADRLDVSYQTIHEDAIREGISIRHPNRSYSFEETTFLMRFYYSKGPQWCAAALERDAGAVKVKALSLGLHSNRKRPHWRKPVFSDARFFVVSTFLSANNREQRITNDYVSIWLRAPLYWHEDERDRDRQISVIEGDAGYQSAGNQSGWFRNVVASPGNLSQAVAAVHSFASSENCHTVRLASDALILPGDDPEVIVETYRLDDNDNE